MVNLNLIFDFLVNFYSEMFTRNVIPLSKKKKDRPLERDRSK
jgi:hypothetical protein